MKGLASAALMSSTTSTSPPGQEHRQTARADRAEDPVWAEVTREADVAMDASVGEDVPAGEEPPEPEAEAEAEAEAEESKSALVKDGCGESSLSVWVLPPLLLGFGRRRGQRP